MKFKPILVVSIMVTAVILSISSFVQKAQGTSSQDVVAGRNNGNRTGAYINETVLTPTNVSSGSFGKLFARPVIGDIYAQPLYVAGVTIPNQGVHNVVYVATAHNTVYAFDADDTSTAGNTPLWSVDFGAASRIGLPPETDTGNTGGLCTCDIWDGEVGILGTPVIDESTMTMYLVSEHAAPTAGAARHYLHALDITTGAEKFNGPTLITATVPGNGQGSSGGQLTLNSYTQLQRPALVLLNGSVYMAFGAENDIPPWHGWVIGYSASNIAQQVGAWVNTPNGGGGGIWSDFALATDGTYLYTTSGNGTFEATTSGFGPDYGDSAVKLNPAGGTISLADWYVPSNEAWLDNQDLDLGVTGPTIIPGTNMMLIGGKQGWLTVLNTSNLGHYVGPIPPSTSVTTPNPATDTNVIQEFDTYAGSVSHMHNTPTYWNGPNGPVVYVWTEQDYAKGYQLSLTANPPFNTIPFTISASPVVATGMPPGVLSLSANGSTNGIIWASVNNGGYGNRVGVLYALDATNLTHILWSSQTNPTRDAIGTIAKFNPPMIANGKVFQGSFALASEYGGTNPGSTAYLNVYGLLPTAPTNTPTMTLTASSTPVPQNTPTAGSSPTPTMTRTASSTATPGGSAYAALIKGDGPVSYWRLGETSGTVAADSVDGNPGTIQGGVTLGVPGAISGDPDTAMKFDGSTGYISAPDNANLDITGDLTVETWANASALNGLPEALVNKGYYQYRLGVVNNSWRGTVFFTGVAYDLIAPTTITTGQWYHIAMTRSGTTLTLYINGVAVGTTTTPTGASDTSTLIMAFGRRSSTSADFFNGALDEIAVYNKALSAAQILAHYNAGQPGTSSTPTSTPTMTSTTSSTPVPDNTPTAGSSPTPTMTRTASSTATPGGSAYAALIKGDGPVSYWRLGETSGTVAADSVDGNPGTIQGGVTLGVPGAISGDPDTAMKFDGSTGYISAPDNANLDITGDLTVETWANASALNGLPEALVNKGYYQYRLGVVNNSWRGTVFFKGVAYDLIAPTTITTGQWYHIAMTRSGTTLTLYINGVAVATTTTPTGASDTSTVIMAFGRRSSTSADFFNGALDEIAVYNKALSAAQILAHYNAGQPGTSSTPTSTPTATSTPTMTLTASSTPVTQNTSTPTSTPTMTLTASGTPVAQNTPTATSSPTMTLTASSTPTPVGSAYAALIKGDGPVSYWRLGETSGTVAADSVDGNPGTIQGGVTLGVPGAIGGDPNTAMIFDGSTGYISVPDKSNLDIRGDLTVETWANATALNGLPEALVNKGDFQYRLGVVNNKWRGSVFFKGVAYDLVAPTTIITGQWYHIAMTRSGTTLTLYVNGAAVATTTTPSGRSDTSKVIMAFGRRSSTATDFFNGALDEIAVYNKALSAAQILAHYNAGQPPAPTATSTPTGAPVFVPTP